MNQVELELAKLSNLNNSQLDTEFANFTICLIRGVHATHLQRGIALHIKVDHLGSDLLCPRPAFACRHLSCLEFVEEKVAFLAVAVEIEVLGAMFFLEEAAEVLRFMCVVKHLQIYLREMIRWWKPFRYDSNLVGARSIHSNYKN